MTRGLLWLSLVAAGWLAGTQGTSPVSAAQTVTAPYFFSPPVCQTPPFADVDLAACP